jgi:hypothetical protein
MPQRDDIEGFSILKGETIEDAYQEYEKKFGVKPNLGWQYMNLVYLVKPEVTNG